MKKLIFITILLGMGFSLIAQENAIIRLKVVRDSHQDETIVKFKSDATYYHDASYDAVKMFSSNNLHPQIWTRNFVANDNYAINTIPLLQGFVSVMLGFKTNHVQTHEIHAYDFASIDTNTRLYLHDLLLDSLIELRSNQIYSFHSEVVNNVNRFRLYFASETTYSGGDWNYGLPDTLVSGIILDGTFVIEDTALAAYDLIIHPCAALTIAQNATLHVKRNLTVLSSGLQTGSLINYGSLTVDEASAFQKLLEDITTHGWNISMPVSYAPLALFDNADALWKFEASTAQWETVINPELEIMRGYVSRFAGQDKLLSIEGNFNNGILTHNDLVRTGESSGNFGWNFIGNPYPSAIHWDSIPQSHKINLNGAIYFRMLDGNAASYVNGNSTNGGSAVIPPMQAFWIQVESGQTQGELTINNNALVHHCQPSYKNNTTAPAITIELNNSTFTDETIVAFNGNATAHFDKKYDAIKMFSSDISHPQVYSKLNGQEFAINVFPKPQSSYTLPVGFIAPEAATLSLSFEGINSFAQNFNLKLEDTYNNTLINLFVENTYTFSSNQGTFNERFLLHFEPKISTIKNEDEANSILVYYTDKHIHIMGNTESPSIKYFEIINTVGQKCASVTLNGQRKIYPLSLSAGIYFVNLYSRENKLIGSHKIASE